jgi:hypothetical protein
LILFFSPNIIRVVKSRIMRWAGHVACKGGEEGCIQDFGWVCLREGDHLEDRGVDARIILKWICKKWEWAGCMDSIDLALVNAVMNLRVP